MLDVKEAVAKAQSEIALLFPDFAQRDLRLEEAETPLRGGEWRFTFSSAVATEANTNAGALADLFAPRRTRKVVELHPENGDLISIKAA